MGSQHLFERILRIREVEEEQSRRTLEVGLAELAQLELRLRTMQQRERAGRSLVNESASSGEITDRIAGMEESRSASRWAVTLTLRIRSAEAAVATLRQDYLEKRTGRMQAETLAETERAREAAANFRRSQRALDDWYLNRRQSGDPSGDGERN